MILIFIFYWYKNFSSLESCQQQVGQELVHLTPEQVQSITGYDFILDALLRELVGKVECARAVRPHIQPLTGLD